MLDFRRMVDVGTAAFAAERRTQEDLNTLERVMAGREEEGGALVRWHTGFHDALTKAAHNQYLEWAGVAIRAELFLPVERAMSEHRVTEIERVHDAILSAVRERDPDRAAAEMRTHVSYTEKLFETMMVAHMGLEHASP
jgi:DNA-binding FadR family transcriptional regulator